MDGHWSLFSYNNSDQTFLFLAGGGGNHPEWREQWSTPWLSSGTENKFNKQIKLNIRFTFVWLLM